MSENLQESFNSIPNIEIDSQKFQTNYTKKYKCKFTNNTFNTKNIKKHN